MILGLSATVVFAGQEPQFTGVVNSGQINIRIDSTVSSETICKANKNDRLEVVKEHFGWYKVRLPAEAPAYIKKSFTVLLPEDKNPGSRTAKVEKENVNIRLGPGLNYTLIGKADKNEIISIVSETPDWYRIQPTQNCFGWINKQFVDKAAVLTVPPPVVKAGQKETVASRKPAPLIQETVVLEGTIAPYGKVFGRKATHKLEALNNKTYLLKGSKKSLDDLNYQKVRITGVVIGTGNNTIIEVKKMEAAG